jgi:hypothetical protein
MLKLHLSVIAGVGLAFSPPANADPSTQLPGRTAEYLQQACAELVPG